MNIKKIISTIAIISILGTSTSYAAVANTNVDSKLGFVPVSSNTYTYNKDDLKKSFERPHGLYKIECSKNEILKALGITNSKFFSIGVEQNGMDWTYDLKNCSLYGNRTDINYNSLEPLSKDEALKMAKEYIEKNIKGNGSFYNKLGEPVVTYRNYGPMYKAMDSVQTSKTIEDDVDVDNSNVTNVEKEYTNYSITFPFVVAGKNIYSNYGVLYGITMEVYKSGVVSVNIPLLKFKLVKKTSTLMSLEDIQDLINKGSNTPYYGGNGTEINLSDIQSVYVVSSIYKNGKTENYLSTGLGLFSKTNVYDSNEKYKQIISDYKVGNNNIYY